MVTRARTWTSIAAVVLSGAFAIAALPLASPAGAEPNKPKPAIRDLAGDFEGTTSWVYGFPCFVDQSWDATYTGQHGVGDVTFDLDTCVNLGSDYDAEVTGTFSITTRRGTMSGGLVGTIDIDAVTAFTLTSTGGTGAYEQSAGQQLTFDASWTPSDVLQSTYPMAASIGLT
jgi:hypothetical protein